MPGSQHAHVSDQQLAYRISSAGGAAVSALPAVSVRSEGAGAGAVVEESTMTPEADHFRLAVAVFDEPSKLARAVESLASAGIAGDQVCLLARAERLRSLAEADGGLAKSLAPMLARLQAWPGDGRAQGICATAGTLLDTLLRLQQSGDGTLADPTVRALQRPEFAEPLSPFAITVVVRSLTPSQQSMATRALLSLSSHRVKTYEFTLPDAGVGQTLQ